VGEFFSDRFIGDITDIAIGWDDAGQDTPEAGVAQIIAVGPLANIGRTTVKPEVDPWFEAKQDGLRIAEICAFYGIPLAGYDPGRFLVVPMRIEPDQILTGLHETADAAGGVIWATRSGDTRYADSHHRYGAPVELVLDACDILVTPTLRRSLAGLANRVRLTYGVEGAQAVYWDDDPASIAAYGLYAYAATVLLVHLPDVVAAVDELLLLNAHPAWMLDALPVAVADLDIADTTTLLGLEMHSRIQVGGLPATGATPTTVDVFLEGWTERLAWGVYQLDLSVSDYSRTVPTGTTARQDSGRAAIPA
jgi:hypothetical protein